MTKKYLLKKISSFSLILILTVLFILLFVSGCSNKFTTIIEDLSVASPATFAPIANSPPLESSSGQGNSYVKVAEQNQTSIQNNLQTNVSVETSSSTSSLESEFSDDSNDPNDSHKSELEKKVYREGDLIAFDPIGVDPDGDIITYSYSRPLNASGQWQTEVGDVGTYQITITASDSKTEVEKKVILLILSSNRAPSIENLDDLTVAEGDLVQLTPKVFDYNGDTVEIHYSKPFNDAGEWQTTYNDAGTYLAKVTVSDNMTSVEKQITIVVTNTGRAPVLLEISPITVVAGEQIQITPSASDLDNDLLTYIFSDPLDAKGTWQTTQADEGTYTATVTATDGTLSDTKTVTLVVNHKNQAPVISMSTIRAEETDKIVLAPTIVDPEGDSYIVIYDHPFETDGTWQTRYNDSGSYDITITATDSNGAVGTALVRVEVLDKNRAPTFQI